jgi:N-acyl-D-aspartate/D-glutamate deacylase
MVRAILGFLSLVASGLLYGQTSPFDVLITGARVIDGAGGSWYYADVGIRGDTIAAVGLLAGADAAVRVDGRGLVAAPGFIDIHSHGRRGIFAVPTAENYLREGVTTIVEGPDGSSAVPLAPFLDKVRQTPLSSTSPPWWGKGAYASR